MNESSSQPEKPIDPRRSDRQYKFLKLCSEQKDEGMERWNKWRKRHPHQDICLQGRDFSGWYLRGINFTQGGYTTESQPEKPVARNNKVHLEQANFESAILNGAQFLRAHLENARFLHAQVKQAYFCQAHLEDVELSVAHLEGSDFGNSFLKRADLTASRVHGAKFYHSDLRECIARGMVVDGETNLAYCKVNRYCRSDGFTDFELVALSVATVDPGTKQLLEYNIRRKNWELWYDDENEPIRDGVLVFSNTRIRLKTNKILTWLVRKFWEITDYGMSTKQIIKTFFQWAIIFAGVYFSWGLIDYHLVGLKDNPGIVSNLFSLEGRQEPVAPCLVPFRTVYFSIVTMTTLGFGDMYANTDGFLGGLFGHTLLSFQVILGYVLLGALITRFAVLFTAGGPAERFAD